MQKNFVLNLNSINIILFFLGIILYKNIPIFIKAVIDSSKLIGPILLLFPFYSAIMNTIINSGIADLISNYFISIASLKNFQLLVFYSASLINLFIPSGGGQWVFNHLL